MKTKRGFTIVELVIVIAVIAILAAVLIPTFSSVIQKAKRSADVQLCRNMNTLLAEESVTGKPKKAAEVRTLLASQNYSCEAGSENRFFFWLPDENVIVLYDAGSEKVEYPSEYSELTLDASSWKPLTGELSEDEEDNDPGDEGNDPDPEVVKKKITFSNACVLGSGALTLEPSESVSELSAVKLDGTLLTEDDYSISGNDLILKDGLLDDLALGYHEITLVGENEEATGKIKIAGAVIEGEQMTWEQVCELDCGQITDTEISQFSTVFTGFNSERLSMICFPDTVNDIGFGFCYQNINLTTVYLSAGISSSDNSSNVFEECANLTTVYVPAGTVIGTQEFLNCSALTDIYFDGTKSDWDAITKGSNWDDGTGDYTVHCSDGDLAKAAAES